MDEGKQMTEKEKCFAQMWYDPNGDDSLVKERAVADELCTRINQLGNTSEERQGLLQELFPTKGKDVVIMNPIWADYGKYTTFGNGTFINRNAFFMDEALITIGKNCLIGMNAVIMDNVLLGDECIVGALSFIKADEQFEARSLIVGNPAKKIKEVSNEMTAWKTEGTKLYQQLPAEMYFGWKACEPLREIPEERKINAGSYKTWNHSK